MKQPLQLCYPSFHSWCDGAHTLSPRSERHHAGRQRPRQRYPPAAAAAAPQLLPRSVAQTRPSPPRGEQHPPGKGKGGFVMRLGFDPISTQSSPALLRTPSLGETRAPNPSPFHWGVVIGQTRVSVITLMICYLYVPEPMFHGQCVVIFSSLVYYLGLGMYKGADPFVVL